MSLPIVSVVVPAFNVTEWIGPSLSSVVAQTYPKDRLEIVVVDDGSTDDTAEEARRILEPSGIAHEILQNASPQGPSTARNIGWRRSTGTWIQFLDADDLLEPTKIAAQARVAMTSSADVAALFSPWGRLVLVEGQWSQQRPWVDPTVGSDPLLDVLSAGNFLQIDSVLFSRKWLETTGGFVDSFRVIEDVDLLCRIVMCGGVLQRVGSERPLAWYRQRAGSLSRESERAFIDGCVRNARSAEEFWRRRQEITAARAHLIADVYFLGTRYYAEHDPSIFRALIRDVYRLEPRFLPPWPLSLRLLTRLVGYARAERFAARYRRLKRAVGGPTSVSDRLRQGSEQMTRP